jgi:hypothetical protein
MKPCSQRSLKPPKAIPDSVRYCMAISLRKLMPISSLTDSFRGPISFRRDYLFGLQPMNKLTGKRAS